jgi:lipoprotein signal peptidase
MFEFKKPDGGNSWYLSQILIASLLVVVSQVISFFVEYIGLFYMANKTPLGFNIDITVSFIIIIFITWSLYQFNYIAKYSTASILIIAGAWSNFLERAVLGSVRDYIYLYFTTINLPDILIWSGLIWLNLEIWILEPARRKKQKTNK